MAISRFRTPTSIRSNYIEQQYIPDFSQFAQVLSAQQQKYDLATSLADLPVDGLQGSDLEYAKTLRAKRFEDVDAVSQVFTDQGINAGNRALRDLTTRIRREEMPGGESYELKQRKANFMAFQTQQQQRLQKGEIKPWQYKQSVELALENYNTSGGFKAGSNLNLNGRPNAIDFDKFANEFIKNKEADFEQKGFMRRDPATGNMQWTQQGNEWINKGELQRELSGAYMNAASQTGELNDYFNTVNPNLDLKQFSGDLAKQQQVSSKVSKFNASTASKTEKMEMQKLMQQYGVYKGGIDGDFGKKSNNGLNQLKSALSTGIASASDQLTELQALSPDDLQATLKNQFLGEYVNKLAEPYAAAKSYTKQTMDIKSMGRTMADELALHKAKKDIDNESLFQFFEIADAASKSITSGKSLVPGGDMAQSTIETTKDGSVKISSPLTRDAAKANTNNNMRVGWLQSLVMGSANPLFNAAGKSIKENRETTVELSKNDPRYTNTEAWLKRTGKLPADASQDQISKAVGQALIYEQRGVGVKYTPSDSKEKLELETTLFNRKNNKQGKAYTAGFATDRGVFDMMSGLPLTAQQVQKLEEDEGGLLSVKGKVKEIESLGEYGSITAQVGNKRLYIPPSEGEKRTPEYLLNRLYSASSGGGVGHIGEFETGGIDALGLPAGRYKTIFTPDESSKNPNIGQHIIEVKQDGSNSYVPIAIFKDVNYEKGTFKIIPLTKK